MPSKWIEHIKEFAKSNNMSYKDALKDPKCKSSYKEGKGLGGAVVEKPNIEMKIEEVKKGRGRPKKYATAEEAKKAKSAKTMESNKRKKAEKGEGFSSEMARGNASKMTKPSPELLKAFQEGKGVVASKIKDAIHGDPVSFSPAEISEVVLLGIAKIALYFLHKKAKKVLKDRYGVEGSWLPILRLLAEGTREAYQRAFTSNPNIVRNIARIAVEHPDGLEVQDIEEGGMINPLSDPAFAKKYAEMKAKDTQGKGLNAGYKTENPNGLGHIYPITHEAVLQMLSCCSK